MCTIAVLMLFCTSSFSVTKTQAAGKSAELGDVELVVQQAEALITGEGVETAG